VICAVGKQEGMAAHIPFVKGRNYVDFWFRRLWGSVNPQKKPRAVSKGLATKNEPILISFERLYLPGFENLEGLGQENRNKIWQHFQF
jgi:hypothetical protein